MSKSREYHHSNEDITQFVEWRAGGSGGGRRDEQLSKVTAVL